MEVVGEFTVKRDDIPVEMNFSMIQLYQGCGMDIDYVVIRPTTAMAKEQVWSWYTCVLSKVKTNLMPVKREKHLVQRPVLPPVYCLGFEYVRV